jgi:hypothetical protein
MPSLAEDEIFYILLAHVLGLHGAVRTRIGIIVGSPLDMCGWHRRCYLFQHA